MITNRNEIRPVPVPGLLARTSQREALSPYRRGPRGARALPSPKNRPLHQKSLGYPQPTTAAKQVRSLKSTAGRRPAARCAAPNCRSQACHPLTEATPPASELHRELQTRRQLGLDSRPFYSCDSIRTQDFRIPDSIEDELRSQCSKYDARETSDHIRSGGLQKPVQQIRKDHPHIG